jgi:hypothetical protein
MRKINEITRENLQNQFDLKDILEGSLFYPSSGTDTSDIECLSMSNQSFVHVDYSIPRNEVESVMRNNLRRIGYDLIGLKYVSKEELTPNGFTQANFQLNEYERERLEIDFIRDRFYGRNFTPFVWWAVYELNPTNIKTNVHRSKRVSLLHIGGEACATFEALYVQNKINPSTVAIIMPGHGYGDNWTVFPDPEFRLYQSIKRNALKNKAEMPKTLLTGHTFGDKTHCFWPDFKYKSECHSNGLKWIYSRI